MVYAFFVLAGLTVQAQDYMSIIADQGCKCIEDRLASIDGGADKELTTVEMGLCMIEAAQPYAKQLKKDHKVDFAHIDRDGEKLGTLIGLQMATRCPQTLVRMTKVQNEPEVAPQAVGSSKTFEGTVVGFSEDQFITLTIADDHGKRYKFLWLGHFRSDLNPEDTYRTLEGIKVHVNYREQEFYEPKLKEYRAFNVIEALMRY